MKVLWLFPPSEGFPNISQYRFFKRMPIKATVIYPYLAASGITQLAQESSIYPQLIDAPTSGADWVDVMAEACDADLIILEARAPIMAELKAAISQLRGNKKARIAVYGDHATWDPAAVLAAGADFVICGGDYDIGAYRLARMLNEGETPRAIFHPGLSQDLDLLPWVDRELVDWHPYFEAWHERKHFFWTMSSRGCSYPCIYCAWASTFWDRKIRFRNPIDVAREMIFLYETYGSCEVLDDADCFNPSVAQTQADMLREHGISEDEIRWGVQTHPNLITNLKQMKDLKRAGLSLVKLGLESGNQSSLDKMKKCLRIEQSEKAIRILQEAEISVHANMVVGWPWENKEEAYHSIEWIKKLKPNQAQFSLLIPYPNTELFDMAKSNGWIWQLENYSSPMLRMQGLSPEEVVKLYQDAWRMFYLDPKFLARKLMKVHDLGSLKQLWNGWRSVTKGHMKAVE